MKRSKTHNNSCGVLQKLHVEMHRRNIYPPPRTPFTRSQRVMGIVIGLRPVTVASVEWR